MYFKHLFVYQLGHSLLCYMCRTKAGGAAQDGPCLGFFTVSICQPIFELICLHFFLLGMQALDLGTYFDVFFCCQIEEIDTLSHDSWRLYGEDESCIWRNRNQAQTVWEVSNIIGKRKGYVTGCSSFLWWFFFSFSWVAKQVVGREGPSGSRSLNCLANVYYIHCKA